MREFNGVYRGFSPTDESDVGLGEIEISIADDKIKFRIATGLTIFEEEFKTEDFRSLTLEEAAALWANGTPDEIKSDVTVFKCSRECPELLFVKDPETNEISLAVKMGMGDILGPTVLFGPQQLMRGEFEKAVQEIEQNSRKGVLPRLHNNGKAEEYN